MDEECTLRYRTDGQVEILGPDPRPAEYAKRFRDIRVLRVPVRRVDSTPVPIEFHVYRILVDTDPERVRAAILIDFSAEDIGRALRADAASQERQAEG